MCPCIGDGPDAPIPCLAGIQVTLPGTPILARAIRPGAGGAALTMAEREGSLEVIDAAIIAVPPVPPVNETAVDASAILIPLRGVATTTAVAIQPVTTEIGGGATEARLASLVVQSVLDPTLVTAPSSEDPCITVTLLVPLPQVTQGEADDGVMLRARPPTSRVVAGPIHSQVENVSLLILVRYMNVTFSITSHRG